MTEQEIAEAVVCGNCFRPHRLIWQSWRELFICGWCKREYTLAGASKLRKLSVNELNIVLRR